MTTSIPNVSTSDGGTGLFADATDLRYRSMLRYLGAVAYANPSQPPAAPKLPTEPVRVLDEFVRDVMVTGVVAAREGAVFKEIVEALVRNHVSAVPVLDETRRVIGVVSESDLLARVSGGRLARPRGHRLAGHAETRSKLHAATARELMTAPAVTTTPGTRIADAARIAADGRVRRLPVVDGAGVLVGIVTRADLLRPFLRPDAEIRADVTDNVVVGAMILSPYGVDVEVDEGVVRLSGQLERKLMTSALVESVRGVAGVVDVDDTGLGYRFEDSATAAPSPLMY